MNKKVLNSFIVCLTFLLMGMVIIPAITRADSDFDWVETFESSDSLNDWDISHGNYTVNETLGTLVSGADYYHTYAGGRDWYLNYIWRNSTPITGKWSFDLFLPSNFTFFIFYYVGISAIADGSHPEAGYTFIINPTDIRINYRYASNNAGNLDSIVLPDDFDGWHHFDINRNQTGHIWVLLNGTNILNGIDTYHTHSERINIQTEQGAMLDNISYVGIPSDDTDTTTTTDATSQVSSTVTTDTTSQSSPFLTPIFCLLSLIVFPIFRRRSKNLKSKLD